MEALPIILDTDIGDDVDDAYALVLAGRWADADLVAVTCVWMGTLSRGRLVRKLLDMMDLPDVPVYTADEQEGSNGQLDWAADYPYQRPSESAAEAIVRLASERPGELTLVPVGPLSNVGKALDLDPDLPGKLKGILLMGGQPDPHVSMEERDLEYNARMDAAATRKVFASGADITMVGMNVTLRVRFEGWRARLAAMGKPWAQALIELTEAWGHPVPIMHDPLALSCLTQDFCTFEPLCIHVDEEGRTIPVEGTPNCRAAVDVEPEAFIEWYAETISR